MKNILLVAYHFPPCRGSSGLQRTLSFSRYLPNHGWTPVILTANPRAYPDIADDQLGDVPANIHVARAFALDAARHLAWRGRYFDFLALPDRWVSWVIGGVWTGLKLIRQHRPKVIWSTHPIPSAHLIGLILCRLTGIPWIADFRDPMTEIDSLTQRRYPSDPRVFRSRRWLERRVIQHSTRSVFVAPATLQMYADQYPDQPREQWVLIPNGYDEQSFVAADKQAIRPGQNESCVRLLHSGVLYTADRDPSAFFSVLQRLRDAGHIASSNFQVILRATGDDDYYRRLIRSKSVEDLVRLETAIPYREALAEMLSVHGLLVFQGQESNANIPAKLYEYLRARRPIFALVDAEGDTAKTLRAAGVGTCVSLHSEEQIEAGLIEFLRQLRSGTAPIPQQSDVERYSREARTKELATLCDLLQ
jgi:glycosyltransferase involved in cell wall biosynthesis